MHKNLFCAKYKLFLIVVNKKNNWVLGDYGETCDNTCRKSGKQCDSSKQSELTTPEKVENAMNDVGVSCIQISGPLDLIGTAFFGWIGTFGMCVYLSNGVQPLCDKSLLLFQPLCYCASKLY